MDALNGLRDWAKDRPKLAAGIGGGVLCVLVLLILVLGGGDDVAPVVGSQVDPAAQGTEAADGTLVAQDPNAQQQDPAVAGQPGQEDGADARAPAGGPVASEDDRDAAYANEQTMNSGLAAPAGLDPRDGAAPLSSPPQTNEDVEFVGRKLELAADAVEGCLAEGKGDIFECLKELPDGFHVERIYETDPQGATIRVEGNEYVGLRFRDGVRCRTLGTSADCNAWTATSG